MEEPEGPANGFNHLHHDSVTFAQSVWVVHEERLEGVEVQSGRRQQIKWVDGLLLLLRGSGGSSGLLGLLLGLEDGLHGLLGHLDLSEDSDELGKGGNTGEPGAGLGGSLGEANIEDELEWKRESASKEDVSEGYVVANEPVASKGRVDGAKVLLDALAGLVEHRLGAVWVLAEDSVDGLTCLLHDTTLEPVHPLVDLCALDGVGTEEGGVTVGKELGDGLALAQVTLGGLKKRELVRRVECLVCGGLSVLFGVNDNGEVFASKLGGDLAHVDHDVAWELGVDFL